MQSIAELSPQEARQWIREQRWQKPTAGMANGYTQANLLTDIPKYRVYRHGVLTEETTSIEHVWQEDSFPAVHGAPVHIGNPSVIGIKAIDRPDFGDPVSIRDGEVPVFWACGVTPQAVAMQSKPDIMITHAPGHMFITNLRDEQFGVL